MNKDKGGRPRVKIDYDLVYELSSIMCTQDEIAEVIGCSTRTLQRDEEFCRVYKNGQMRGHASLRRKQWKLADTNSAMAIFLGKQYLGQSDVGLVSSNGDELLKNLVTVATMINSPKEDRKIEDLE